ncbi:GntR family transcriptional regulator [Metarhizobium album]|uniref:GntR family transcriptional regulator n=1 Tax=Metarhizobium album TaxID=2182425 RepID=A0A2U2DUI7_9HYPH|nr:GntR family transcriptional regulator [Rhizobium album]PWE56985.1 GntR family transcriptional regulator [Rhizobium album]
MDVMDSQDTEQADGPSTLQLDLARRIIDRIRDAEMSVGTRISAPELARLFGVSRSPISGALELLVGKGVLQPMEKRGLRLARDISTLDLSEILPNSPIEELYRQMLRERAQDQLPQEVSEAELMPRYGVSRGIVRKLLMRFAAEGLAQRLPGHGWRFVDTLVGDDAYRESYEFRAIVECSALRTPNFKVDAEVAAQIRRSHERILRDPASRSGSDEWFRVNAFFHENLAGFSGNRFLTDAIRHQNNLRRMQESAAFFELPAERIEQSCREHLAILGAVEDGNLEWAEALLRQHLKQASEYGLSKAG